MAGRLYRMAKVVSANPKSWGIVDANEISGFKRVAKLSDLYSIAECILSSSYGDGVTDGADAVGQIWHVSETNGDYKLTNWANRKSAAGWTKLSYGGDVSVPVKDVQVTKDNVTASVLSNGIANINLTDYAKKSDVTDNLKNYIAQAEKGVRNGVAPLDRDNMIPLQYLGHLDMTVFTVVESLPTSDIENKVYLVKSSLTSDKNIYSEYIYTGNRNGVYDATKWEKLGEVAAKTDLSEYYKKTEVYNKAEINKKTSDRDAEILKLNTKVDDNIINTFTSDPYIAARPGDEYENHYKLSINLKGGDTKTTYIKPATNTGPGVMTYAQKVKLDGIAAGANNYTHPPHTEAKKTTKGLYKITVDDLGHVNTTTAVTKDDIIELGIPGSAPTVDTVMSETSTNAVQNNVIDNAIKTHSVSQSNFKNVTSKTSSRLLFYSELMDGINHRYLKGEGFVVKYRASDIPDVYYTKDGISNDAKLLYNTDMTALTDTELNEILI